jgi:hypothetical protein
MLYHLIKKTHKFRAGAKEIRVIADLPQIDQADKDLQASRQNIIH